MADSTKAVKVALAGAIAVSLMKLCAAALTGSSAMFSEGIHSAIDAGDEALLLYGKRRSRRPPDEDHPFGHGQELYFWTLIVALVIFTVGGAVSVYEGILTMLKPVPPTVSISNYIVLGASALFEGASFVVGIRQFRAAYPRRPFLEAVRISKDPTVFMVVFEDTSDLLGLAIAFLGVSLSQRFHTSLYDGIASILIGAILMSIALIMVRESKGLLTGEGAEPGMTRKIQSILKSDRDVEQVNPPITMHFGPENVLLAAEIQFRGGLTASDVARAVDRLESSVQSAFPQVKRIFIEAESIRSAAR